MHLHSLLHLLLIYCDNIMIEFFNVFLLNLILKFFVHMLKIIYLVFLLIQILMKKKI